MMASTKIEFLVQMTCESCVNTVKKSLEDVKGVKSVEVDLNKGSVVVESNLPTLEVQKRLESTGKRVAIKGWCILKPFSCLSEFFNGFRV